MNARVWAARLLAGVTCAALLAGCASAGNGSQDPMTVVKGTVKCPTVEFASPTPDANGIQAIRDGTVECTIKADDPRVSGTRTDSWNMDVFDPDGSKVRLVQWGTSTIKGPSGTWEGTASGVAALPEWGDIIATWYKGTGEYAGLSYFEQVTGKGPWRVQGMIFTGDPPTPGAATTP
jgi:hypothetical protein